jgi:hypothetical protein
VEVTFVALPMPLPYVFGIGTPFNTQTNELAHPHLKKFPWSRPIPPHAKQWRNYQAANRPVHPEMKSLVPFYYRLLTNHTNSVTITLV